MGVSKNRGTPKSSILIGFSITNHPFWGYPYCWKHPYRCLLKIFNQSARFSGFLLGRPGEEVPPGPPEHFRLVEQEMEPTVHRICSLEGQVIGKSQFREGDFANRRVFLVLHWESRKNM